MCLSAGMDAFLSKPLRKGRIFELTYVVTWWTSLTSASLIQPTNFIFSPYSTLQYRRARIRPPHNNDFARIPMTVIIPFTNSLPQHLPISPVFCQLPSRPCNIEMSTFPICCIFTPLTPGSHHRRLSSRMIPLLLSHVHLSLHSHSVCLQIICLSAFLPLMLLSTLLRAALFTA